MLVVSLDTTTRPGSLAVIRDEHVLISRAGDPGRPHAERLPGELVAAVEELGFGMGDIDAFGVAVGPGSFTGLRIGLASIQGLAYGTGRPVVGVSAFEALATAVFLEHQDLRGAPLGVWLDAQRQEVFGAVLECADVADGLPVGLRWLREPSVGVPAALAESWQEAPWFSSLTFAGEGARMYRPVLDAARPGGASVLDVTPALAPAIGLITAARARRDEATPPHALKPLYVRRPDAELARDRRLANPA